MAGELLDPYAGVNPGEFFAVATEVFFDRPSPSSAFIPTSTTCCGRFYRQDPAAASVVGDTARSGALDQKSIRRSG